MEGKIRRRALIGVPVGIVVLALTSVAFACTGYRGSTVVSWITGASGGGGTVTGFGGDGLASSMGYCPGAGMSNNYPTGMVNLAHGGAATIGVQVQPFSCTTGQDPNASTAVGTWAHLSNGVYDVNFYGGNAYQTFTYSIGGGAANTGIDQRAGDPGDCMDVKQGNNHSPANGENLGQLTVTNGTASGQFVIPASDMTTNSAGFFANVCVTDFGGGTGSPQVPVVII
jgi:hypothetical protein